MYVRWMCAHAGCLLLLPLFRFVIVLFRLFVSFGLVLRNCDKDIARERMHSNFAARVLCAICWWYVSYCRHHFCFSRFFIGFFFVLFLTLRYSFVECFVFKSNGDTMHLPHLLGCSWKTTGNCKCRQMVNEVNEQAWFKEFKSSSFDISNFPRCRRWNLAQFMPVLLVFCCYIPYFQSPSLKFPLTLNAYLSTIITS